MQEGSLSDDMSPMRYRLKLLKGGYIGDYIGDCYIVTKRDARNLDYGSYQGSRLASLKSLFSRPKTFDPQT